jgi:hypothetical protein
MRTQLRYGFCHTIILDKDSKFYSVCQEALDLLQIYLEAAARMELWREPRKIFLHSHTLRHLQV